MQSSAASQESPAVIVGFDSCNRLAVLNLDGRLELPFCGEDFEDAFFQIETACGEGNFSVPQLQFSALLGGGPGRALAQIYFSQIKEIEDSGYGIEFHSIESLEKRAKDELAPELRELIRELDPHLLRIPYLHLGENDFIYKFRPEKERNVAIYANDAASSALYQSKLCELIKARARTREGSASAPVVLDFGAVAYHIPSHFGFCLGVKNAIERAYEALAANPGRRVFMLSELIHNPFVNADLLRRGLRYLQSDKGVPFTVDGKLSTKREVSETTGTRANERAPKEKQLCDLWDTLTSDDVVIIPAFGATDEDKRRLVRKGVAVCQYDATCMLVEKVWKAARNYGRKGYTVIIHGKAEHEETKATFSNTRRYAPALIVRDLTEVQQLGRIITATTPAETKEALAAFYEFFKGKHTPGFDPMRDLQRVAVVNQTTLLVNETRAIIDYLRERYNARYGAEEAAERVGGSGKNDTLCYATQVNQDALDKALEGPLDAAFVIGGTNSSNTYQLYRLCEKALGERAHFIQSECDILSAHEVEHFVFPYARGAEGHKERRPLWMSLEPKKHVLITGGASCPDGIIQQVITRLNGFFAPETLRSINSLLDELAG